MPIDIHIPFSLSRIILSGLLLRIVLSVYYYYYYYYYYYLDVSCHRPFLPGTSLEPAVILTAQASSFTLQYFPYYL